MDVSNVPISLAEGFIKKEHGCTCCCQHFHLPPDCVCLLSIFRLNVFLSLFYHRDAAEVSSHLADFISGEFYFCLFYSIPLGVVCVWKHNWPLF